MENQKPQVPLAVKRFEIFKSLWAQGFGRTRMLDFALHNQLFEPEQLKDAETDEGRERAMEMVKMEFRAIQKEKKEARQEYIIQLLALRMTKREITNNCVNAKLVPNPNPESAYHLVRKDIIRMTRRMRQEDMEFLPMARSIYQLQMGRIFRDAMASSQSVIKGEAPDYKAQASLLKVAKEAADSIATVNKVDVTGRQQEIQKGFDLASEAARAVIEHVKAIRQGEATEDGDYGAEGVPERKAITEADKEEALDVTPEIPKAARKQWEELADEDEWTGGIE